MTKAISEAASAPALEQDVEPIDWRRFIHADKSIIAGKPIVKGTRLGAEFILRLFAGGMTTEEVLENYPSLTPEALRAVFSFAAEVVGEEIWSVLPPLER